MERSNRVIMITTNRQILLSTKDGQVNCLRFYSSPSKLLSVSAEHNEVITSWVTPPCGDYEKSVIQATKIAGIITPNGLWKASEAIGNLILEYFRTGSDLDLKIVGTKLFRNDSGIAINVDLTDPSSIEALYLHLADAPSTSDFIRWNMAMSRESNYRQPSDMSTRIGDVIVGLLAAQENNLEVNIRNSTVGMQGYRDEQIHAIYLMGNAYTNLQAISVLTDKFIPYIG